MLQGTSWYLGITSYCRWLTMVRRVCQLSFCRWTTSNFTRYAKKNFLRDVQHYFWDEPYLYRWCADGLYRRCVLESELNAFFIITMVLLTQDILPYSRRFPRCCRLVKFDYVFWTYITAYKTPVGTTPFNLVYGKSCHVPVVLEYKTLWATQRINFDFKAANKNCLIQLNEHDELQLNVYENKKDLQRTH